MNINNISIDKIIKILKPLHLSPIFIFIFLSHIFGILIEGFTESCLQRICFDSNIGLLNRNLAKECVLKRIMYKILFEPTMINACIFYWEQQEKGKNVMSKFIRKLKLDKYNKVCDISIILLTSSKSISEEFKNNDDLYRWRELSFMLQTIRSSFIWIILLSIPGILLCIVIDLIMANECYYIIHLGLFFLICCIISIIFLLLTKPLTFAFSKRFVRELASYYNTITKSKKFFRPRKGDR
jgi:hypothetical protein